MYIAQGRWRQPQGTKFWCQQEVLITLPICCNFQRNLFEVWFYTFFLMIFCMYIAQDRRVYSPRTGRHTAPRWQSFDVNRNFLSLRSSVAGFKSWMTIVSEKSIVLPFSPYKSIRNQIWPCRKIGQGQPRVIIYLNFVELESPMLHAKFQDHRTSGSGEEDF